MGCVHSLQQTGNDEKCPFCNADQDKSIEEKIEEMTKRVQANDANSICELGAYYYQGLNGLQQDNKKGKDLYAKAAKLDHHKAHYNLADIYHFNEVNLKKAKFHYEAAAMLGCEVARCNLGVMEYKSGNMDRAIKHWLIAASVGHFRSMHNLRELFHERRVSRETIDSTLAAYNSSCAEMRSEPRDACIQRMKNLLN
jgi:TPR repeat protein